jgi:hypothetical protein
MTCPSLFLCPRHCLHPTRSEIYLPMPAWWYFFCLRPVNCGLPAEVTWSGAVMVPCRVEIGICGFSCPAGGCYVDAAIYLAVGFPPIVVYLRSTRDLLWRLGACFRVDHQALAVWLGDKLVLLLMLFLVSSAQCSLFHRLTRMMNQDFVHDFLCFPALGYPREVLAYGAVLHWCMTHCYVLLVISYLLHWLTRTFSLFHFFPVASTSFANVERIGTQLKLLLSNLVV